MNGMSCAQTSFYKLTKSLVFAHAADRNHTFRYEDAEVISVDARKGGRLIREAWYSGAVSPNRHVKLHPAYKALRLREQSRKRANSGDDALTQRLTETIRVDPDQDNNVRRWRTRERARAGDDTPIPTTAGRNKTRGGNSGHGVTTNPSGVQRVRR